MAERLRAKVNSNGEEGQGKNGTLPQIDLPTSQIEALPVAVRFRMVLEELGTTYVKLGQVLSCRPDLLPADFIKELSKLQDQVEPVAIDKIKAQVEKGLGKKVEENFTFFNPEPLASGSIAQTHVATLHGDQQVVVKVQRPGIDQVVNRDLDLLYILASLVEATIAEAQLYDPVAIVREFDLAINQELDFSNEAANMQRFFDNFKTDPKVIIPKPYGDFSSKTVLTMDLLEGHKITTAQLDAEEKKQLAKDIMDIGYQMVFEHGFFHADPHPGNFLVMSNRRIGVMDFGLVGTVTPRMQDTMILLSLGIYLKDVPGLAKVLYRLGAPQGRVQLAEFRGDIQVLLDKYLGIELSQINTGNLFMDLLDLAVRYHIKIPSEYALLAKAGTSFEGIIRTLYPDMDVLQEGTPYAKKLLKRRYNPSVILRDSTRLIMGMSNLLQEIPAYMDQILIDLEAGKLTVRIDHPALTELNHVSANLGNRIFLGSLWAGLIIATAIMISASTPTAPSVGLGAAWAILGFITLWHFAQSKLKKIRISRMAALWRRLSR